MESLICIICLLYTLYEILKKKLLENIPGFFLFYVFFALDMEEALLSKVLEIFNKK